DAQEDPHRLLYLPQRHPRTATSRDIHGVVTGELRAPKGARVVRTGGRWKRTVPAQHLASGLPVFCDPDSLAEAWMRVRRNRGAKTPGIDGVTAAHVERRAGGVSGFLAELRGQLKAGEYRPS